MATLLQYDKRLNIAEWFEFFVQDSSGAAVTGVTFSSFVYAKQGDTSFTSKTINFNDANEFLEIGNGWYKVSMASGEVSVLGVMLVVATPTTGVICEVIATITNMDNNMQRIRDHIEGVVDLDKKNAKEKRYKADGSTLIATYDLYDDDVSAGRKNAIIQDDS